MESSRCKRRNQKCKLILALDSQQVGDLHLRMAVGQLRLSRKHTSGLSLFLKINIITLKRISVLLSNVNWQQLTQPLSRHSDMCTEEFILEKSVSPRETTALKCLCKKTAAVISLVLLKFSI